MDDSHNSFQSIERALRRHRFGTLSTLTKDGRPHTTAVVYAVSASEEPLAFYVTTRTTTEKAKNIRRYSDVAFVVPIPRWLPLFPPAAIQFQGTATVVAGDDASAVRSFSSSWFHRRILATEHRIVSEGGEMCFIRIQPDPKVFTYGVGMSPWRVMRHARQAIGRTRIPDDRLR